MIKGAAGVIYCAQNLTNQKVYIGQTVQDIEARKWGHISYANSGKDTYFGRALLKYGLEGFRWFVLCDVEALTQSLLKEYLNVAEQIFIKQYDSMNGKKGYNCTQGGDGRLGFVCLDDTKRKISKANKGKCRTDEFKKRISGKGNPMFGREQSKEAREKVSIATKGEKNPFYGRKHSEEARKKMGGVNKGKQFSEETRRKMSESHKGEKHHMFGKHHSIETKRRIKENHKSVKGRHHSVEAKRKIRESKLGERNPMFGKSHTEETKQKMRESRKKRSAV